MSQDVQVQLLSAAIVDEVGLFSKTGRSPQTSREPAFRFRPFHLFLLIFEFFWLGIAVPGHTRGIITLGCPSCHADTDLPKCCQDKKTQPTPDQKQRCAICAFALHLTLPAPINLRLRQLCLVDYLPVSPPESWLGLANQTPYHGRAPPVLS